MTRRTPTLSTAAAPAAAMALFSLGSAAAFHNHLGAPLLPLQRIPRVPPLASVLQCTAAATTAQRKEGCADMIDWLLEDFGGTSTSVTVDSNEQGLRGLHATKDARSGAIVVEIPYDAALLVGDTLWATIFDDFDGIPGSEGWDEEDLDDAYQGLNFLQTLRNDPEYAPYVESLPEKPASSEEAGLTPDFWPEESIRQLEVPAYVQKILDRKRIVEEVAKKNGVDEHDLRWATWMIRSRRFTTWNMIDDPNAEDESLFGVIPRRNKIEQIQGFLLPLIDMANHAHDPNAALKISVNRWTREFDDTSTFALRALRPIKRGEEVTIAYGDGDRTSLDFLDKYGFFLEGNPADETIDWDELGPEFTTSLAEDEAELAALEGSASAIRQTTLSLRVLMKRLSNWKGGSAKF
ncbi:hypothetical protein ACHAXT_010761 [Thalassiosira profunda]